MLDVVVGVKLGMQFRRPSQACMVLGAYKGAMQASHARVSCLLGKFLHFLAGLGGGA